jgi:hypothetical protein
VEELNDNKLDGTKSSEDKHVEVKKEVEDDASSENRNDLTGTKNYTLSVNCHYCKKKMPLTEKQFPRDYLPTYFIVT